jgi:hypothetical protein
VQTLTKAIDLNGSPLEPPKPVIIEKPKEPDELSLESLTASAMAPSLPGGIDLG